MAPLHAPEDRPRRHDVPKRQPLCRQGAAAAPTPAAPCNNVYHHRLVPHTSARRWLRGPGMGVPLCSPAHPLANPYNYLRPLASVQPRQPISRPVRLLACWITHPPGRSSRHSSACAPACMPMQPPTQPPACKLPACWITHLPGRSSRHSSACAPACMLMQPPTQVQPPACKPPLRLSPACLLG